jgi:hypothetical protein
LIVFTKDIGGMIFLNLQGQFGNLWLARANYRRGRKPTYESIFILIAIVLLHVALIFIALNAKFKQRETSVAPAFKMIYLSQEKPPDPLELHIPVVERASVKKSVVVPEIVLVEQPALVLLPDLPQSNYELSNPNDAKYGDVFDPKMRQKLIDAQSLNIVRSAENQKSWTASDGTIFLDNGDGQCRNSMPNSDTHSTATNWSTLTLNVPCSKDEGGRIMDNVNAALEARKHPLNFP